MGRRLKCVGEVAFSSAEQSGNDMAIALASAGVNREVIFKAWW